MFLTDPGLECIGGAARPFCHHVQAYAWRACIVYRVVMRSLWMRKSESTAATQVRQQDFLPALEMKNRYFCTVVKEQVGDEARTW